MINIHTFTQIGTFHHNPFEDYAKYDNESYPEKTTEETCSYLLEEQTDLTNERMYAKKMHTIKQQWGLQPTDDLGIARCIIQ